MKLSIGAAQRLLIGLNTVDRDEKTKLGGPTRLAVAININLLQAPVEIYERQRQRTQADLVKAAAASKDPDAVVNAEFMEADAALRDGELELGLKTITTGELKLDDNPRITGAMVALLAPVLSDLAA